MSEASRRKRAVCLRAARGVVGFWVVRKVRSHWGEGCRDLLCEMCVVSWGRRVLGWDDMGWWCGLGDEVLCCGEALTSKQPVD